MRHLYQRKCRSHILDIAYLDYETRTGLDAELYLRKVAVCVYEDRVNSTDTTMHLVVFEMHLVVQEPLVEVTVVQGLRPIIHRLQWVRILAKALVEVKGLLQAHVEFLIVAEPLQKLIGYRWEIVSVLSLHGYLQVLGALDLVRVARSHSRGNLVHLHPILSCPQSMVVSLLNLRLLEYPFIACSHFILKDIECLEAIVGSLALFRIPKVLEANLMLQKVV